MPKQIAVRLPDDLVAFVDARVAEGIDRSRAEFVRRALERERRRAVAERDARILTGSPSDPGLDALAARGARTALDLE